MEVKANFKRIVINGYHPANQATIFLQDKLENGDQHLSLGELREKHAPNKENMAKAIRKFWHDSYSVEEFRGSSLNNSEASYFIAFSLSLMDNEPQNKLESIVDQIIDEIQKSQ